jgi:HNH endonuclease
MPKCIFCENELTQDTTPEHVLLNALNGRMTTKKAICSEHNNIFGGTIDKALAAQVEVIRNHLQLLSGTKKPPPPLKNLTAGSEKISIGSDGVPRLEVSPFVTVELPDGRFDVKIMVRSEEELHRVLPHVAAKLNIPLDELKQQMLSGSAVIVERCPDTVGHHLSFGGEDALRSIAKSCFVLLATKVRSDALKGAAFEDARNFVLNGSDAFYRSRINIDARLLPCASELMAEYGDLFNLIYVKSDSAGRVIGHFTLYNLVSWQLVLAEVGGGTETAIALVSDPLTSKWNSDVADRLNVDFGWLNTVDQSDVPARARKRLEAIAQRYFDNAREREFGRIVQDACEKRGIKDENEPIPNDKLDEINIEVSARVAAHSLGLPFEDKLTPERLRQLLRLSDATSD